MDNYGNYNDRPAILPENIAEKHVACAVLVDTSDSMKNGNAIGQVNEGIRLLIDQIMNDSQAQGVVDLCIIEFNSDVSVVHPFAPISKVEVAPLKARGMTSLNQAILTGLDLVEERRSLYKTTSTLAWRPWLFLITDGLPTDPQLESEAKRRLQDAMDRKRVIFFPVAVSGADEKHLASYPCTKTLKVTDNDFTSAFKWLSTSMIHIGNSDPSLNAATLPELPTNMTIEIN